MRLKLKEAIEKVHKALLENNYQTAKQLAVICFLKESSIHRIIRLMRLENIGIITCKQGYVLSEFASKNDDVGFIRRCYGRRTGDIIAIRAAEKDINKRWRTLDEKNDLKLMISPLISDIPKQSLKIMLSYKNSKGI